MTVNVVHASERFLAKVVSALETLDLRRSVAALSLFLGVIFGFESAYYKIPFQVALVVVLLRPRFLLDPILWIILSLTATLTLVADWSTADNHKYLLVYWMWVVALSTSVEDEALGRRILGAHARFFLIFVFLAAAIQKLSSPTYMSGEMFEGKLLLDTRFQAFSHLVGIDRSVTDAARLAVSSLKSPFTEFENNSVLLPGSDFSRAVALAVTWYDLLVQVAIGLLFIPRLRWTDLLGHVLVLFFVFTTYLPAPVYGFGWTISIYGFTLAKDRFRWIHILYFAALIAVLIYQTPWRTWVLGG